MSPASQRSLACAGMRHLEQLGRRTEETPGTQRDEMARGWSGGNWGTRGLESEDKGGSQGPYHKKE